MGTAIDMTAILQPLMLFVTGDAIRVCFLAESLVRILAGTNCFCFVSDGCCCVAKNRIRPVCYRNTNVPSVVEVLLQQRLSSKRCWKGGGTLRKQRLKCSLKCWYSF